MSDAAKREPGWYWGTNPSGRGCPIECQTYPGHKPLFLVGNQVFIEALPNGWTLGPRVEDLLRDAARIAWLGRQDVEIMRGSDALLDWGPGTNPALIRKWIDESILYDAALAREPKPEE